MKGITVCCDGEKSLKKELSHLATRGKKQTKKKKNNLLSILDLFSSVSSTKLET